MKKEKCVENASMLCKEYEMNDVLFELRALVYS